MNSEAVRFQEEWARLLESGHGVAVHPGEVGRYALEPVDAVPGAAQLSHDTPSPFLVAGRSVGQRFAATADWL